MPEETKTPADDGAQRRHAYFAPNDDRLTLVDGGRAMSRADAIALLRRAPPKNLANASEVELFDDGPDPEGSPWRPLGKARIAYTIGEMLKQADGGIVVGIEASRLPR